MTSPPTGIDLLLAAVARAYHAVQPPSTGSRIRICFELRRMPLHDFQRIPVGQFGKRVGRKGLVPESH